jgi:hypothetical protein
LEQSAKLGFVLLVLFAAMACSENESGGEGKPSAAERAWEKVENLYEKVKGAKDTTPQEIIDWAKEDIQRIGDWEYKVIRVTAAKDDALEKRFSELGRERWEIFWLERDGRADLRVFLKRSARSYLRSIPLSDLSKLVPNGAENQ